MERNVISTMKKVVCSMLLCLLAVLAVPGRSEAASKTPKCVSKVTAYYYSENGYYGLEGYSSYIYIKNLSSSAKITSVKSSNSKITAASVLNANGKKMNAIELSIQDPLEKLANGTTTKITFKVKQGGKTYKLTCKVTLKKAASPVKTFKVGSKNYASSFKGTCSVYRSSSAAKMTVTVKAASGYKIDSIYALYMDGMEEKIKSGQKISTTDLLCITVYYSVKTKPAYYKTPEQWGAKVSSPLQEYIQLWFQD